MEYRHTSEAKVFAKHASIYTQQQQNKEKNIECEVLIGNPITEETETSGSLGLLVSQSSCIGDLQVSERPCFNKQDGQCPVE